MARFRASSPHWTICDRKEPVLRRRPAAMASIRSRTPTAALGTSMSRASKSAASRTRHVCLLDGRAGSRARGALEDGHLAEKGPSAHAGKLDVLAVLGCDADRDEARGYDEQFTARFVLSEHGLAGMVPALAHLGGQGAQVRFRESGKDVDAAEDGASASRQLASTHGASSGNRMSDPPRDRAVSGTPAAALIRASASVPCSG